MKRLAASILVLALAFVSPAVGAVERTFAGAQDTIRLVGQNSEIMAFYVVEDDIYRVTLLISDPEGDVMRVRVPLRSSQTHRIVLGADDVEPQQITIIRDGSRLSIQQGPVDTKRQLVSGD
ncbi:MAG: hypothetical protein AAF674_11395 [Pseudomonadota bacterium]